MLRYDGRQSDGLAAELLSDAEPGVEGKMTFREHEIQDSVHGTQASRDLGGGKLVDARCQLPQPTARTLEALVNVRLTGEEAVGNLADIEATQSL